VYLRWAIASRNRRQATITAWRDDRSEEIAPQYPAECFQWSFLASSTGRGKSLGKAPDG